MKNDSKISIPLVSFSSSREGREPGHERGGNIFQSKDYIRISPSKKLPEACYGVNIENAGQTSVLPPDSLAVFSETEGPALENIYAVGVQEGKPFVGKWMQKESPEKRANSRRKVFMVPTPLHIPDSQASPIAESLHHVLLFKDLANPEKLRLIPVSKILWKHPLVFVQKK
jgi:hypothetical protein